MRQRKKKKEKNKNTYTHTYTLYIGWLGEDDTLYVKVEFQLIDLTDVAHHYAFIKRKPGYVCVCVCSLLYVSFSLSVVSVVYLSPSHPPIDQLLPTQSVGRPSDQSNVDCCDSYWNPEKWTQMLCLLVCDVVCGLFVCMSMSLCLSLSVCVYVYLQRQRQRDREEKKRYRDTHTENEKEITRKTKKNPNLPPPPSPHTQRHGTQFT